MTITFGLFTRFGGPLTAMATLIIGTAAYLVGSYGGSNQSFLLSLCAAVVTYGTGAVLERVLPRRQAAGRID